MAAPEESPALAEWADSGLAGWVSALAHSADRGRWAVHSELAAAGGRATENSASLEYLDRETGSAERRARWAVDWECSAREPAPGVFGRSVWIERRELTGSVSSSHSRSIPLTKAGRRNRLAEPPALQNSIFYLPAAGRRPFLVFAPEDLAPPPLSLIAPTASSLIMLWAS